ncbi:MAG: hypothetical protein II661_00475, partial [Bacteroidales bacterium]|nr:hypothetical protein [Bacteroidales bacterium]
YKISETITRVKQEGSKMKGIAKRAATIFLALAVIFTFTPFVCGATGGQFGVQVVYAEDTVVDAIYIEYDPNEIVLNTAYTEGELNVVVRGNTTYTPENTFYKRGAGQMLAFKYESGEQTYWWGVYDSTDPIDPETEYALDIDGIDVKTGKDWVPALYNCTDYTLASDCPEFSVYVNGVKREDAILRCEEDGLADFIVPLGPVSTDPIIKSVTIAGNDFSMKVGTSHQFEAAVTGNAEDRSVNWSVSGANSTGTSIDNSGLLTIGADESAETVTVTARANANNYKCDTKTVQVVQEEPIIEGVTISPQEYSCYPGSGVRFTATVTGTELDKSVIWSIDSEHNPGTTISDTGYLTISSKETAETITVTVTSVKDPTKKASATVTILQPETVSAIYIEYDPNTLALNTAYTEGELNAMVRENMTYSPKSTFYLRGIGRHLAFKYEDGEQTYWWSVYDSTDLINTETEYAIGIDGIDVISGKDWAAALYACPNWTKASDCPGFSVYVNGEKRMDAEFRCAEDGLASFIVPIHFKELNKDNVALSTTSFTYNGKVQLPGVKDGTKKLVKDQDYTVTIKNSAGTKVSSPKKADTYSVTIKGKGQYIGTVTKTFKINPLSLSASSVKTKVGTIGTDNVKWCTGSLIKPTPTVTAYVGGKTVTLKRSTDGGKTGDYKLTYKNNKVPGTATVTVTGINNYKGSISKTFKIKVKPTTLVSVSALSKGFTAKWNKQSSTYCSGYQIQYSTSSTFKSSNKTVTVSGASVASKKVAKLTGGKKYYVRVRTYKTVTIDGKKVKKYSTWSAKKTVTTKK